MSALERAATALGTRSLSTSTFSEGAASGSGSGMGEAQTDEETKVARSRNFEAFAKDRENISWELNGDSKPENKEPKPWGQRAT